MKTRLPKTFLFLRKVIWNTSIILASVSILLSISGHMFPAYAANYSIGFATYVPIPGNNVTDGTIISSSAKGYYLSNTPYDPFVYGVVNLHPAASFITSGPVKTYPVISSNTVFVNVSSINGNIAKGDYITTSQVPGVGMKAIKSGYIMGSALEGYTSSNPKAIGKIAMDLDVHFYSKNGAVGNSLTDILSLSKIATYEEPTTVVRYVVAAMLVIVSFASGFWMFEKTVSKGIDAIGRNPLASHFVQFGMLINIVIILAVTFGGIFIAYVVLRL